MNFFKEFKKVQLLTVAASLAYSTILSVVPMLALCFAVFKSFGGLNTLSSHLEPFILSNLAQGAGQDVIQRLHNFVQNANSSAVGIVGFIGLLLTGMSVLSSIESAIHRIWGVENQRSWFLRIAVYWLLLTIGPIAFAIALGVMTSHQIPLAGLLPNQASLFLICLAVLFTIYKCVPNHKVETKYAFISAVTASVFLGLAQLGFTTYTQHILNYNKIYGSLAAVPLILLWVYIVWVIGLSGVVLNTSLQQKN